MTSLQDLVEAAVASGMVPGAAALVARGDDVEMGSAGEIEANSIVRIASITKPITAAAVMLLVGDVVVALGDPIAMGVPGIEPGTASSSAATGGLPAPRNLRSQARM